MLRVKNNLVLCIDPAFRNVGVALWCTDRQQFIHSALWQTQNDKSKTREADNRTRLEFLTGQVRTITGRYNPRFVVAELTPCTARSARAAVSLAFAYSWLVTYCSTTGLVLKSVTPRDIKRWAATTARVSKQQVQWAVLKQFAVPEHLWLSSRLINEHVADAMACVGVLKERGEL